MQAAARKYLTTETTGSFVVNGLCNFAFAYGLFHGRGLVPALGPQSLFLDSVGETFIATFLSYLVPCLIARHRRRAGTLPMAEQAGATPAGNFYMRSLVVALLFTFILTPANYVWMPRMYPAGVSFWQVVFFKTLYGAVIGAFASWLAIYKSLHEVEIVPSHI